MTFHHAEYFNSFHLTSIVSFNNCWLVSTQVEFPVHPTPEIPQSNFQLGQVLGRATPPHTTPASRVLAQLVTKLQQTCTIPISVFQQLLTKSYLPKP